jgi:hypothetical protein
MNYLHEMANDSFVLVQADWSAGDGRELIKGLEVSHVIIHRTEPGEDYYYLYTRDEARQRLDGADDEVPVTVVFDLHEWQATPVADAFSDAEQATGRWNRIVVMDEGDIVGFYDAYVKPDVEDWLRGDPGTVYEITGSPEPTELVPRSLVTKFPVKVPLEKTVSLLVHLSKEPQAEPESLPELPVTVPLGATVDVVVEAKRGFEIVGDHEQSLVVVDASETLPVQFKLKATELGQGDIRVLGFHQGGCLGMIRLAPVVVASTEAVSLEPQSQEQEVTPVSIHQPDLSLLILETRDGDQPALVMRLTATDPSLGLFFTSFGPVRFRTDPAKYVSEFFAEIDKLKLKTESQRANAADWLEARGADLYEELFPEALRIQLWALKDRIKTVQILSEEPWIPWEVCRLVGKEGGDWVEGDFLCQAFSLTRWIPGVTTRPRLTLNNMAVVIPETKLKYALEELDYVKTLEKPGIRQVKQIPATRVNLRSELAQGTYDGWHFSGHGTARSDRSERSAMVLEKGEKLTPQDLSGRVMNLGKPKPLVFLNACQLGQSGMSLTDIGGWAAKFLKVGAGAFVGAYWSIYDRLAVEFAQAFYDRLLAGVPIGKAAQEARLAIKPERDPTWLAYTVYADPLATVQQ